MKETRLDLIERNIKRLQKNYETLWHRTYARDVRRAHLATAVESRAMRWMRSFEENVNHLPHLGAVGRALKTGKILFTVSHQEYQQLSLMLGRRKQNHTKAEITRLGLVNKCLNELGEIGKRTSKIQNANHD